MTIRSLLILPLLILIPVSAVNAQPSTRPNVLGSRKSKTDDEAREAEERKPPFVGMTKAQARARYGDPKQQTVTDEGEQWTYLLNFGEVIGKAFIPFNFKPTPIRTGTLIFGRNGKVKTFRWDAETNG